MMDHIVHFTSTKMEEMAVHGMISTIDGHDDKATMIHLLLPFHC